MPRRAITYTRVSTKEQDDTGHSLDTQLKGCQQLAAKLGLEISPDLSFTDDFSGATLERPGLTKLRSVLKSGDLLIVHAFDRLSRDDIDLLVICRELERSGINITSVTEGDLPDGDMGNLLRFLYGMAAKKEREKILERTQRGKHGKAAAGKWVGNSHPSYGYQKVGKLKECMLAINPAEAETVRTIFDRFARGDMIRTIADDLTAAGVPAPSRGRVGLRWYEGAIKHVLRCQVYLGIVHSYGNTIHYPDLAIISPDLWEAAQRRLANNRRASPNTRKRHYLLSSFLHCICGQRMYGLQRKPRGIAYLYYICYSVGHRLNDCHESVLTLAKADAIVWGWITSILCDDERREAGLRDYARRRAEGTQTTQAELTTVDELIVRAERKVNRYAAEFGNAPSDEVADALRGQMDLAGRDLAGLRERRARLQAAIEQGTLTQAKIDEIGRMTAAIRRRLPGDPTTVQMRDLFDVLGVEVKLRRDELGLRWLDMSCGIPDWTLSTPYDSSQIKAGESHSHAASARCR